MSTEHHVHFLCMLHLCDFFLFCIIFAPTCLNAKVLPCWRSFGCSIGGHPLGWSYSFGGSGIGSVVMDAAGESWCQRCPVLASRFRVDTWKIGMYHKVMIHIYKLDQHTDCSKALKGISLWSLDAYVTCFVRIGEVKDLGHLAMKLPQEPVTATTKFHLLDISKLIVPRLSHRCQKCLGISCCPKSLGWVWGYIFMSAYKHPVESPESISFYVPSTGRQEVELLWLSHTYVLSSFGVSRREPQWSK